MQRKKVLCHNNSAFRIVLSKLNELYYELSSHPPYSLSPQQLFPISKSEEIASRKEIFLMRRSLPLQVVVLRTSQHLIFSDGLKRLEHRLKKFKDYIEKSKVKNRANTVFFLSIAETFQIVLFFVNVLWIDTSKSVSHVQFVKFRWENPSLEKFCFQFQCISIKSRFLGI